MYQALYRKWRPQVFEDVSGQPQITATLKNEVIQGSVAHAYLFTGSRGTGKTTCAKILAKAVNCLHPHDGDPCNECSNCRGIDQGSILDVVEIDAASNNGVDNIRELREEAVFSPAVAKYRVYIIDEAHMLSQGAFNALLKTLEEPPAYVIFILATTEVHKIPATILSRCQRFDFRRIPMEDIAARLEFVAAQEKIALTHGAALLIARLGDGALRDALSLLDRCAGSGAAVDEETVAKAAGLSGREYLHEIAAAVREKDFAAALRILGKLYDQSKDVERLCEELIGHFRSIMLLKSTGDAAALLNLPPDETEKLKTEAGDFSMETVLHVLDTLQGELETLRRSTSRRVEMEMCLLRLCSPEFDSSNAALLRRIAALEEKLRSGMVFAPQPAAKMREPEDTPKTPAAETPGRDEEKLPKQEPDAPKKAQKAEQTAETEEPLGCWPEVIESLRKLDAPLSGFLQGSKAFVRGEYVLVDSTNSMFAELIRRAEHQKPLLEAVRLAAGKAYKVGIYKRTLKVPRPEEDKMEELLKNANSYGIEIREK